MDDRGPGPCTGTRAGLLGCVHTSRSVPSSASCSGNASIGEGRRDGLRRCQLPCTASSHSGAACLPKRAIFSLALALRYVLTARRRRRGSNMEITRAQGGRHTTDILSSCTTSPLDMLRQQDHTANLRSHPQTRPPQLSCRCCRPVRERSSGKDNRERRPCFEDRRCSTCTARRNRCFKVWIKPQGGATGTPFQGRLTDGAQLVERP